MFAVLLALAFEFGSAPAQAVIHGRNGDIAFDSRREGDSDLFLMNAAGANERRLEGSARGAEDARPSWAPSAGTFVFFSPREGPIGTRVEVRVPDLDGLETVVGVLFDGVRSTSVETDPATGQVFATIPPGAGTGRVCVEIRPLHASPAIVTRAQSDEEFVVRDREQPAARVGCPSQPLAFESDRTRDLDLWALDPAQPTHAGNPIDLLPWPGSRESAPTWSSARSGIVGERRDAPLIAFASDRGGSRDIWILDPFRPISATNPSQITSILADDANPDWSPNGRSIAFESDRDGQKDLWIVDIAVTIAGGYAGTNLRKVTTEQPPSYEPNWFSYTLNVTTFEQLALSGPDEETTLEIHYLEQETTGGVHPPGFVDANGILVETLPEGPGDEDAPAYAPFGDHIAFQSNRHGHDDIFVYDRSSLASTRLTDDGAADRHPAWQPLFHPANVDFHRPWGRRKSRARRATSSVSPPAIDPMAADVPPASQGPPDRRTPAPDSRKQACTISGTPADDVLRGTPAPDVLCGQGGDDVLRGGFGDDVVRAGTGDDVLTGGRGHDRVRAGRGDDRASGNPGNDIVDGGAGRDRVKGGSGDDEVLGGNGRDRLHGGAGSDTLAARDGRRDRVRGGAGRDEATVDRRSDLVAQVEQLSP